MQIERKWLGVHEFKPNVRGECFTNKFSGQHPKSIQENVDTLNKAIKEQLFKYKGN